MCVQEYSDGVEGGREGSDGETDVKTDRLTD